VVFIADDEASAETVLQDADIQYTMRPALTIRMENQPSAGAATFRKLANAGRLPQQALDRMMARCDMTLYDGQSPGHAADGGGREGARGRCCRPGRCGKAQSDALLAQHGFCALAGIAGRPGAQPTQRLITLASRAVIGGVPSDRAARRGHRPAANLQQM
jgi:hypothetical protein